MNIFINGKSFSITQINLIGVGGEGSIYKIKSDTVVKIFKNPEIAKIEKIKCMLSIPVDSTLLSFVAWPLEEVCDENNSVIGYSMHLSHGTSLKDLEIEQISVEDRLIIAYNLAAVCENLHSINIIIGDMNPANFLIDGTHHVTAIDADSFHIVTASKTFRCCVGCRNIIPSELQDKFSHYGVLSSPCPLPTFTKETDSFSLACLIYYLVCGTYPFCSSLADGLSSSAEFISENRLIAKGILPAFNGGNKYIPPIGSLSFSALPKSFQDAFLNTFINGSNKPNVRTTPKQWMNIIDTELKRLKPCSNNNKLHMMFDNNTTCPYCEAEKELNQLNIQIAQNIANINYTPSVNTNYSIAPYNCQAPVQHYHTIVQHRHNPTIFYIVSIIIAFVTAALFSRLSINFISFWGFVNEMSYKNPLYLLTAPILTAIYCYRLRTVYETFAFNKWWILIPPFLIGFFSQQLLTIVILIVVLLIIAAICAVVGG
ncbi:MAG: hypothetical protein K6F27_05660 [Ruminococcus sp.]|nr:hypothetical protein [Ruminococcus sp.]